MDIVITEIEQNPRTSVLDIRVNTVGSSSGSSFFIACSLSDLAPGGGNPLQWNATKKAIAMDSVATEGTRDKRQVELGL